MGQDDIAYDDDDDRYVPADKRAEAAAFRQSHPSMLESIARQKQEADAFARASPAYLAAAQASARKDARAEVERLAHTIAALGQIPIEDWTPDLRAVMTASVHAVGDLAALYDKEIELTVADILRRAGRLGAP